jgi:hypothetical protein
VLILDVYTESQTFARSIAESMFIIPVQTMLFVCRTGSGKNFDFFNFYLSLLKLLEMIILWFSFLYSEINLEKSFRRLLFLIFLDSQRCNAKKEQCGICPFDSLSVQVVHLKIPVGFQL